jgi:hypothetical protein
MNQAQQYNYRIEFQIIYELVQIIVISTANQCYGSNFLHPTFVKESHIFMEFRTIYFVQRIFQNGKNFCFF